MSYIDLTKTAAPSTPAANHEEIYVDTADKRLKTIDDTGLIVELTGNATTDTLTNKTLTSPVVNGTLTGTVVVSVPNGGTGQTSLTAHDVLVGNGTGAITQVSPSTAGFVLTSNGTGADPSFQASSGGGSTPNVVQFVSSGTLTTNSTSPQPTALTATITPSSASAIIKVSIAFTLGIDTAAKNGYATVLFDGSPLQTQLVVVENDSVPFHDQCTIIYTNTPGNTSPHTYTLAIFDADGTANVTWNPPGIPQVILLEEVH